MTDFPMPQKATLDAETDQAMAAFLDKRDKLTGFYGGLASCLADGMADQIREQFGPGQGRLLMAAMQALGCIEKVMREDHDLPMPATALLSIGGLAAASLEGEATS